MNELKESALDLVKCEQEPIHAPGAIQSASILLLFDPDQGALAAASDNLEPLFGASASALLGTPVERFFTIRDATTIRAIAAGQMPMNTGYFRLKTGQEHWVSLLRTDGLLGVEINTYEGADHDVVGFGLGVGEALTEISEITDRLTRADEADLRHLATVVTRRFHELSGYDRVMLYRFDTDWNGEVIGETFAPHVDHSFKGLSFPSSDIPKQARALFLRNRVRPVVDVASASVAIVPPLHPSTGQPYDLSDCSIRGVSPVHLEYLSNMGVCATLTLALIVRGKLWGLLACHHYSAPYRLTPGRSSACRLFAEAVSSTIARLVERSEAEAIDHVRQSLRKLRNTLLQGPKSGGFDAFLRDQATDLLALMQCDGMVYRLDGRDYSFGDLPDKPLMAALRNRLEAHRNGVDRDGFSTHFAAGLWPDLSEQLGEAAAGALIYQPRQCNYDLILLRNARETDLHWAGDPYKRVTAETAGERLHPRGSFNLWRESVRDRALPWEPEAMIAARELTMGLNEIDWLFEWQKSEAELAQARAETEHNALHDALTDLPNRRYLQRRLDEAEQNAETRPSALVHIDLDRFKQVNDTMGHSAGDELLIEVARRLKRVLRSGDFPARVGGDEFLILAAPGTHPWELDAMGDRIIAALSRPVTLSCGEVEIGASVGIALNTGTVGADELFYQADLALYESKRNGRGRVTQFSEVLQRRQEEKQRLGEDIREGIRSGRFEVWYQPQFKASDFALCGVEALLRWNHPDHGILSPAQFLDMAEDLDLVATLDSIGMQAALQDLARLETEGLTIPKLSLNVSARRLQDPSFLEAARNIGAHRELVSFELLESIYLDELTPEMEANLTGLREMGIPIEVDDFGTGRTSIVSLVTLRPDRLKIDRQLIEPVVRSDSARKLVASIVEIGQSLGIDITAEGVETRDHAEVLRGLGCTVLQGFHFARPMPVADLRSLLAGEQRRHG
ncbi:diguanylate cyclase (GGDEF)-like protein [Rhodobacter aestuarii]|uniref:Diguanylate cyclase (GGDEF) domain-containing protein n=1 Tax=Rhodobacter aestuarii TaxID=453582 RepID=A0A1N7NVE7_9RHOB|nr:EAL domain-containing protein [Rhodobacter aestuarii]PTV94530.1 diguanylate cyclase (GGDEF)-like protein [Rhodobacter aestuarii]SIT02246.1 diguanylate cyclase (GGDEF) domain-containing protein [Rhodobacter aestuarii]